MALYVCKLRVFLICLVLLALCGCTGLIKAIEQQAGEPPAAAAKKLAAEKKQKKIPPKPEVPKFKEFLRDRPYLRVRLPDRLWVTWGWPHETGVLLRAVDGAEGPRMLIQAQPQKTPLDWDKQAKSLAAAEKKRLTQEAQARDWGPVEQIKIGGLRGIRLDFMSQGVYCRRYLTQTPGWLYTITLAHKKPAAPEWMEQALISLGLTPFSPAQAAQEKTEKEKDLNALIYSLCPVQIAQALGRLAQQRKENPKNTGLPAREAEAFFWRDAALGLQGRPEPALDWWDLRLAAKKAVNKNAKSAEAWRALALARIKDGQQKRAQKALERSLDLASKDAANLMVLALTAPPGQQKEPAAQSVETQPAWAGPRLILASILLREKRVEEARRQYRLALRLDALNTTALLGLARLLMDKRSSQKEAAQLLAQVIQLDPQNSPAAFNLAMLRLREGQAEETLHLLQPILLENPQDAAALNLKGLALRAMKRFPQAAEAFGQAVQADPRHAGAFYNQGALCATELKDLNCARRAFKAFLALEPSSERAIKVRAWLTRQGY